MEFLEDQCSLTGPLPGLVVENHGEAFAGWRSQIEAGAWPVPFRVTRVDAHADLGNGDAGFVYLMGELLFSEPSERTYPWGADHPESPAYGLGDGNFLAFAAACRWIAELDYVFNDEGGDDVPVIHMEDFDIEAPHLELKAADMKDLRRAAIAGNLPPVVYIEPRIPFNQVAWRDFHADSPFNAITLSRSPAFTPSRSDELFSEIRRRFITED
jgi:hypothetical protein